MSILGSYVLGDSIPVSEGIMEMTSTVTTWLITAAMVGLGLNVSLGDVRTKALKPLIAMVITSIVLSVITFFIVLINILGKEMDLSAMLGPFF